MVGCRVMFRQVYGGAAAHCRTPRAPWSFPSIRRYYAVEEAKIKDRAIWNYRSVYGASLCTVRWRMPWGASRKCGAAKQVQKRVGVQQIRNFGIVAHVDSGKTTLSERILYYAAPDRVRALGDVHDGNTQMDFLAIERERGITVQSAAARFPWRVLNDGDGNAGEMKEKVRHAELNLIDTPGHVDFSAEVVHSLRVLDGAVCVVDAPSGVQAQTRAVWRLAAQFGLPTIAYLNKMDRSGASFSGCVSALETLHPTVTVVPLQVPIYAKLGTSDISLVHRDLLPSADGHGTDTVFVGCVDIVRGIAHVWHETGDGTEWSMLRLAQEWPVRSHGDQVGHYSRNGQVAARSLADIPVASDKCEGLREVALQACTNMIESLGDVSEAMCETIISGDTPTVPDVVGALRECVIRRDVVPVLCGSALANVGVQPLVDGVVRYLPSPAERGPVVLQQSHGHRSQGTTLFSRDHDSSDFSAFVFRVRHDRDTMKCQHHVRVLSGSLKERDSVVTLAVTQNSRGGGLVCDADAEEEDDEDDGKRDKRARQERVQRIFTSFGGVNVPTVELRAGDIGIISGLATARSGDCLVHCGDDVVQDATKTSRPLRLSFVAAPESANVQLPQPVYVATVEAETPGEEARVRQALSALSMEDSTIVVSYDEGTQQSIVRTVGELHMQVIKDAMKRQFGVDAQFGALQVHMCETVSDQYDVRVVQLPSAVVAGVAPGIPGVQHGKEPGSWTILPGTRGTDSVGLHLQVRPLTEERLVDLYRVRELAAFTASLSSSNAELLRTSPLTLFSEDLGGDLSDGARVIGNIDREEGDMWVRCHPPVFVSEVTPAYLSDGWNARVDEDGVGAGELPLRLALRGSRLIALAVAKGAASFFARGPLVGSPLVGTEVVLRDVSWGGATSMFGKSLLHAEGGNGDDLSLPLVSRGAIGGGKKSIPMLSLTTAAARSLLLHGRSHGNAGGGVQDAAPFTLLEPLMRTTLDVSTPFVGNVVNAVTGATRRGSILSIESRKEQMGEDVSVAVADIPLSSMLDFSSVFRSLTSGHGSYSMAVHGLQPVPSHLAEEIIRQ